MSKKMDVKETKFVAGLISGMTKKDAAISAGFSPAGAGQHATKLLERESVQAALADFSKRHLAAAAIDHERIRQKWLSMAMAETATLYTDDWKLVPKSQVPADVQALVLSARSWNSPEGSGSAVKLVSQLDVMRAFVKAYPPVAPLADSLEDAAASAMEELEELMARLEPDEG